MKQIVFNQRSGELRCLDVPEPGVKRGFVLVQNRASLISSGTERQMLSLARKSLIAKAQDRPDLVRRLLEKAQREGPMAAFQQAMGRLNVERPLGYSCAGVVLAAGAGVDDVRPGDLVACAGAGYAVHGEVVSVPRNLVAHVPAGVSADSAAFAAVGSIAMQGVRAAAPQLGESVAVIGLGLVGLLILQIARAAGCVVIGIEKDPGKFDVARELGADLIVSPDHAEEIYARVPAGTDHVIIAASTSRREPARLAAEICRDRGRVTVVGSIRMDLPHRPFYDKELELRMSRSYGPGRYDPRYEEQGIDYPRSYVRWTEGRNLDAFLELVASGRVRTEPTVTHRFNIEDAERAYDLLAGRTKEAYIGIVLKYPNTPGTRTRVLTLATGSVHQAGQPVLGVIGAGAFGTSTLLPLIKTLPGVRLRGIATGSALSARTAADRYGFEYCATEPEQVLSDPDVNGVVILTRNSSHASLAARAIAQGKHVFVEKPLAVDDLDLARIVDAYRLAGDQPPLVAVGFNRRFAPLVLELIERLGSSRSPAQLVYRINAGPLPPDHWLLTDPTEGGRLVAEACHFVDLVQFVSSGLVEEVYARPVKKHGRSDRDDTAMSLALSDGSVATILYCSEGDRAFGKERLEVFGRNAVAVLDDFRTLEVVRGGRRTTAKARLTQDKGHRGELEAFVAAIRGGSAAFQPFEDTVRTTLATFRILDSLKSGRAESVNPSTVAAGV